MPQCVLVSAALCAIRNHVVSNKSWFTIFRHSTPKYCLRKVEKTHKNVVLMHISTAPVQVIENVWSIVFDIELKLNRKEKLNISYSLVHVNVITIGKDDVDDQSQKCLNFWCICQWKQFMQIYRCRFRCSYVHCHWTKKKLEENEWQKKCAKMNKK